MKLNKSNKDKLIGGIITVVVLFITLSLKECFKEIEPQIEKTQNKNLATAISNDSSKQYLLQQEQVNANQGNVTNEYVFGDKNISQAEHGSKNHLGIRKLKAPGSVEKPPITQIEKIENNGNLSIGQTGGTLNQTIITSPPPLVLTEEIKHNLIINVNQYLKKLPKDSNKCIVVEGIIGDKRSIKFSLIIAEFLEAQGYNVVGERQSMILDPPEGKNFGVSIYEGCVTITVY